MEHGIKDKTAVIGMGCSKFGERFDAGREDLVIEAVQEAVADAGIDFHDIDAFWFGTNISDIAGTGFSQIMKSRFKPVTRIENMCCTGSDIFRNACYAVASGAYDIVMAIGLEKLKDCGFSGLPAPFVDTDHTRPEAYEPDPTAPAMFSLLAPAYAKKYNIPQEKLKDALVKVAHKNHYNGSLNPKAMFRAEVPMDKIRKSPMIAAPYLSVMDCSGVSDGCACAIITRSEDAKKYRKDPMYVKAAEFAAANGSSERLQSYDFTSIEATAVLADRVYKQAGISDPVKQISLAEVHDCFTITEVVLYEDLQFSKRGEGWKDVLAGKFDMTGEIPVNIDGGLKAFGHPIGASGIRMIYESWLQFHEKAGKRQLDNPKLGLAHNLGGYPHKHVSAMTILGKEPG
jgi:acetyl-CoA C-acetyltransferase